MCYFERMVCAKRGAAVCFDVVVLCVFVIGPSAATAVGTEGNNCSSSVLLVESGNERLPCVTRVDSLVVAKAGVTSPQPVVLEASQAQTAR